MKRVGITGGMGCGKSTVAAEFGTLGVPCFEADRAGASCYTDAAFLADLRHLFGNQAFFPDGTADKRTIASLVFADKALLSSLTGLVHPRVMAMFEQFCRRHAAADYVLFESAILYDYGFDRLMDRVVCVYLGMSERLARLQQRDGVGEAQLVARIANQLPAEEMMMRADYVVLNYEGNPRHRQVALIDKMLRQ